MDQTKSKYKPIFLGKASEVPSGLKKHYNIDV